MFFLSCMCRFLFRWFCNKCFFESVLFVEKWVLFNFWRVNYILFSDGYEILWVSVCVSMFVCILIGYIEMNGVFIKVIEFDVSDFVWFDVVC